MATHIIFQIKGIKNIIDEYKNNTQDKIHREIKYRFGNQKYMLGYYMPIMCDFNDSRAHLISIFILRSKHNLSNVNSLLRAMSSRKHTLVKSATNEGHSNEYYDTAWRNAHKAREKYTKYTESMSRTHKFIAWVYYNTVAEN